MALPYTITQSFRGKDKANYKVEDFGDFLSIIDFEVTPNNLPVNGIIFQKITKITKVIVANKNTENILETSKQICDYTNNNVKFMNETYLEYFEVKDNNVAGDQFQNSAITRYIKKNVNPKDVSEYGVILQKGECVFIPSTRIGPLINPNYIWKISKLHASNGLFYFDDKSIPIKKMNKLWVQILTAKQSKIVCHTVEYYWKKDPVDNECSIRFFIERINKSESEIAAFFAVKKQISEIKGKINAQLTNQSKLTCTMCRQNSINSRINFEGPLKTQFIQRVPGGGSIKSKKRRRTVKNRRRNRRKSVKRSRKMH
jgi:hypothetical protein